MLSVLDRLLEAPAASAGGTSQMSSSAGMHICSLRCKKETFRHEDWSCKLCWSRELVLEQELEVSAAVPVGEAFFAVAPCTAGANTVAKPCEARACSTILSHNPAETWDCPRGCETGWRVDKISAAASTPTRVPGRRARASRCWTRRAWRRARELRARAMHAQMGSFQCSTS